MVSYKIGEKEMTVNTMFSNVKKMQTDVHSTCLIQELNKNYV